MMLAFDTPIPFNAIGMRTVSNVPAQALILMNDPLVLQQAEKFANRVIKERQDTSSRIEFVFLNAFSRMPDQGELEKSKSFVASQAKTIERRR